MHKLLSYPVAWLRELKLKAAASFSQGKPPEQITVQPGTRPHNSQGCYCPQGPTSVTSFSPSPQVGNDKKAV